MICEICNEREATDEHHKDNNHKNNKPENKQMLCTKCHAELHGISAKKSELKRLVIMRDRAIRIRNALTNQDRNFSRIEYAVPEMWGIEMKGWNKVIKGYEKEIKKLIENNGYPIWEWLKNIKGISYNTAAKLISYIDIKNTPTISALWRYCGLDASHIKRTRKISQKEAKMFGNPYLKKEMMGILADNFIKQRTPVYRKIYDDEKRKEQARTDENKPKSKMHIHLRAKRVMAKIFLSHLWQEWRRLEKLPVTEPYSLAILKHEHKIEPNVA